MSYVLHVVLLLFKDFYNYFTCYILVGIMLANIMILICSFSRFIAKSAFFGTCIFSFKF